MVDRKEQLKPLQLHLGFLASHNGTDMKGIIHALQNQKLQGHVHVLISNNSKSGAMRYAEEIGLPNYHISDKTFQTPQEKDEAIRNTLLMHGVNLVILSGYMKNVGPLTRAAFNNKILNVHPALLPKHKGLWGDDVHASVLAAGEKMTGVAIHGITGEYDEGPILYQTEVPVLDDDTVETLKSRVQAAEIEAFVHVLTEIHLRKITL